MSSFKHLTPEEEYFARESLAKINKIEHDKKVRLAKEDAEKLKSLHWMHCPKCGHDLHSVPFRGLTIDRCFCCGGVFLDAGELEKLAGKESHFFESVLSLFKAS